jgi:hypothetical protein
LSDEQKLFPRGQIALGNGDLIDVTNIKMSLTTNMKLVHTIRQRNAGFTQGNYETTITLDMVVSEDGPERDYVKDIRKGTVRQLRIKIPGVTFTVNGAFASLDLEVPTDGEITMSLTFMGKLED